MHWFFATLLVASSTSIAFVTTLQSVCTLQYVKASLPSNNFGVMIDPTSVVASPVTNASVSSQAFFPSATFDYCRVEFAYNHNGLNDTVHVVYWFPAPSKF